MNPEWIVKVRELLGPICANESCQLYDVESTGARSSRVLKIFIDAEKGATIEQCANVSNALSLLLDVEDIVPGGKYSLEVSTPGLERNLREKWHYEKVIEKVIKVKTESSFMPIQGPATKKGVKLIKGRLKKLMGEDLLIEDEKKRVYQVAINDVAKAHTVFEFDKPGKKKK